MPWTYDPALLATDSMTQVRFEIGDTDANIPLLSDEEIGYTLIIEDSTRGAAAKCCEVIARRYAGEVDTTLGPAQVRASQRFDHYQKLAKELRAMGIGFNAPSLAETDPAGLSEDDYTKAPIFDKDMMNNGDEVE